LSMTQKMWVIVSVLLIISNFRFMLNIRTYIRVCVVIGCCDVAQHFWG
jgi:hypothetical protein